MARPFLSGARARAKFTVMTHRTIEINKARKKKYCGSKRYLLYYRGGPGVEIDGITLSRRLPNDHQRAHTRF